VEPDLEDTRAAVPRTVVKPSDVDVEDTVARGSVPTSLVEPLVPELVEPPAPEARPVPVVVEEVPELVPEIARPTPSGKAPLRARLADGTVVDLDVAVYLGRKPSVPRIHVGAAPRLVTLPSPLKEISSTHLELRVVGGALVASDMRSTNGTIVRLPGSAPRTLIHGESAVVIPGTRIDLGEGAVLDILPPVVAADSAAAVAEVTS
jgi:hypothetical protein